MTHLGARVTALVDGQLPADEAEEALAHTVTCPRCAELLRRERVSRHALTEARDVRPDDDLNARLLAIGRPGGVDWTPRPLSRPVLAGIGAAAVIGVAAGMLPLVGALAELRSDPHDILATVEGRVGTTPADLPAGLADGTATTEVVDWLAHHGWSVPEALPEGLQVVGVEIFDTDTGEVLELELAGADSSVRVLQQHGQLTARPERTVTPIDGGRWRLGGGRHVVLQSGDCVVVITPALSGNGAGARVMEAMPAGEYDTSVRGRFGRGWQAVAGWASS